MRLLQGVIHVKSCLPWLPCKNVLHVYGKKCSNSAKNGRTLAVLPLFLVCSLRCINLVYMRFHCQIGILALEIAFIPIGACTFLPVREGVTCHETRLRDGAPEACMFQHILSMKATFLHVPCMKHYCHA